MNFISLILLVATFFLSTNADPVRYDNFQVYRIVPNTLEQVNLLKKFEDNHQGFMFWNGVSKIGKSVDIMVPPHLKYDFQDLLVLKNLTGNIWIDNVQQLIDNEKTQVSRSLEDFNWKEYHTLESINAWLKSLVKKYPGIVTPLIGGRTFEGRKIHGVKISFGSGRKDVLIEGGIHGNEWIGPATVTYVLNEFLTSKNASVRAAVESRDWYFFPSINPDGYAYSVKNRMWRKNRRPYRSCVGVDLNRNWGYHWMDGGASTDECASNFAGGSSFSEIETETFSKFINTVNENLEVYLAFHSYSQLILIPFGHEGIEFPENNEELHQIGLAAAQSLYVRHQTHYIVGNMAETLYINSGTSIDWVKGMHKNIRLVYLFELRDRGQYGFLLPPEQIIPSGEETTDSLVRMIQELNALDQGSV